MWMVQLVTGGTAGIYSWCIYTAVLGAKVGTR